MKINIIKLLLLTTIFLSEFLFGQELKISYGGGSDNGGILFSLSRLDSDGNVITKTDPIFSKARIVKDSLMQYAIASIEITGYQSDKSIDFIDRLWLCLNDKLRTVFHYPIGTMEARGLQDGVSLFSYDRNFDIVGAVDSIGNIILQPEYEYITKNGMLLNGINKTMDESSTVVLQCSIFKQGNTESDYTYDVLIDKKIPILLFIHNEYFCLIDAKRFSWMLKEMEYDNDTRLYLCAVHEMLNINYKTALSYFNQIAKKDSFKHLERNIKRCEELESASAVFNRVMDSN